MTERKKEKNVEKREIRQKRWKDKIGKKDGETGRKQERKTKKERAREGKERGKTGKEEGEGGSRMPSGAPFPSVPPLEPRSPCLHAQRHPFSLVAARPCQEPGTARGPAGVPQPRAGSKLSVASLSRGPLLPPLRKKLPGSSLPLHPAPQPGA